MSQQFLGEIKLVGFNFAPRGFSICNGNTIGIQQNTALFSLLGTYYGGNGQTTFQLPNLQGRVAIGQGQSPGTSNYVMGEVAGTEAVTLTSNQMPIHTHLATTTVTPNTSGLSGATTINVANGVPPASRLANPIGNVFTVPISNGNPVNGYAAAGSGTVATMATAAATTTVTGQVTATGATTVQTAGGSQSFGVLQPFLTINYIIALNGIFPSRN